MTKPNNKPPKIASIPILGHDIKIVFEEDLLIDGDKVWGYYHEDNEIIHIRESDNANYEKTILHETIHAILSITGYSHGILNEDVEESLVRVLESGLSQLYERRKKK